MNDTIVRDQTFFEYNQYQILCTKKAYSHRYNPKKSRLATPVWHEMFLFAMKLEDS